MNGALVYNVETRASEAYPADAGGAAQAGEGRTRTAQFDAVCVCSGLHEVPYTPAIAGADSFDGVSLHSCEYKERRHNTSTSTAPCTLNAVPPVSNVSNGAWRCEGCLVNC